VTLANLLPDKEALSGLIDVSKNLESRRYTSWISLAGAITSAVFELIVVVSKVNPPPLFKQHPWLWFIAFLCFATIFVLLRYTGFLLKQSKEPVRYTVYIQSFTQVALDDSCQIAEGLKQIELMPSDLMERIHRRLGRFSLLKPDSQGDDKNPRAVSHFQIEAEYAVRRDKEGKLTIQIWPRVRVGAASNPFTLATPVRLPITCGSALSPGQYEQLVERIYSSVTTEIYKQIEVDLRGKMELFPTYSFRALARYVEGKDFETSNTIDAYDKAIKMYRTSLAELQLGWQQRALLYLGHKYPKLARCRWTGVPGAMSAQARSVLGLARCLIYRRLVSGMSGRQGLPIFEVRGLLFAKHANVSRLSAWDLFTKCYNACVPGDYRVPEELIKAVRFQEPDTDSQKPFNEELTKFCLALSSESKPASANVFRKITEDEELCETAAFSALAQSILADSQSAGRFLQFAEAMELRSDTDETHALILLVKAELEPDLPNRIRLLQQAAKLNPLSEIVLFRLARASDLLARDNEQVTPDNVRELTRDYKKVLELNPGNIASLICQGYLYWLVDDLENAARSFEVGIDIETIVSRTYVGDLKYCLARVEAERGIRALTTSAGDSSGRQTDNKTLPAALQASIARFQEAILADPKVSALTASNFVPVSNVYFDRINGYILNRFKRFHEQASSLAQYQQFSIIRSAALNDYASACLTYFLRFDVGTAREEQLLRALTVYREAETIRNNDPVLKYNLLTACGWTRNGKRHMSCLGATRRATDFKESYGDGYLSLPR
jgi:tetratricopeptide (TPR) repeat protein